MLLLLLLAVLCGSVLVGGSVVTVGIAGGCGFTYRRDGGARVQRGKGATGCWHHATAAAASLGPAS